MFVCVLCAFILCLIRVEGGKNTSTAISANRKRRQKGNPVVSGETASRPKKKKKNKVNEDLSLDKPLQVIYIVSKLAYRI
jgi:hypothetical protein